MSKLTLPLLLSCLLLATPLLAQDTMPTPPENWWENLQADDGSYPSATYAVTAGAVAMKMTLSIDRIEGTLMTYTVVTAMGGNEMPGQTQTVDLAEGGGAQKLPEGAKVTRGETVTVEAAGTSFECTIYSIELPNQKIQMWHSPQIPPIFHGSGVKMDTNNAGQEANMMLESYTGKLIGD